MAPIISRQWTWDAKPCEYGAMIEARKNGVWGPWVHGLGFVTFTGFGDADDWPCWLFEEHGKDAFGSTTLKLRSGMARQHSMPTHHRMLLEKHMELLGFSASHEGLFFTRPKIERPDKSLAVQQDSWDRIREVKFKALSAAMLRDPTYEQRCYKYDKLLMQMYETGAYVTGKDGSINWPSPPAPGETGVVSKATAHLLPPQNYGYEATTGMYGEYA
tara:strand:+ start:8191 stop:8838 length:648 start_codon:yes stop_codon:yes gene_type:complete